MPRKNQKKLECRKEAGFTLMELIVSVAIFGVLAAGALSAYSALVSSVRAAREKTVLASLAANYMEIVKNMPYSQVGTINGNPAGQLADFTNAIEEKIEAYSYKIYYEVTYVDDPADGTIAAGSDPSPADYKQVKMSVLNTATGQVTNFLTSIVPKGLEGLQDAGALRIKVFNFAGQPIPDADIRITHPTSSPAIILDRKSDAGGEWTEVGLPSDVNNYRIVVTKPGYTQDRTYPVTEQNPNPIKPDATIVNGQVTEVSFSIDLLSSLVVNTLDSLCQNLSGVDINVRGAKLIGLNPNVYKFNQDFTSENGQVLLPDIEWDTYTPTLLTGQSWVVLGTSPVQKIEVQPGTAQTFTMILGANSTANSLLVVVKDAATGSAIEGAQVHLIKGGSVPQDYYGTSGGSVWLQGDWTGGAGQENWPDADFSDRYYFDDGNIDINSVPLGVRLRKTSGRYHSAGWLESSTFDTGTETTDYTTISWAPTSQAASTLLLLQLATATSTLGPWNFVGPDGTSDSYYEFSGSNVSQLHDNNRYIRYKAWFSTADDKDTPVLSSLQINYVSGCFTPGQYWFGDLTAGNNYDLEVTYSGYQTSRLEALNINGNQSIEVLMSP